MSLILCGLRPYSVFSLFYVFKGWDRSYFCYFTEALNGCAGRPSPLIKLGMASSPHAKRTLPEGFKRSCVKMTVFSDATSKKVRIIFFILVVSLEIIISFATILKVLLIHLSCADLRLHPRYFRIHLLVYKSENLVH